MVNVKVISQRGKSALVEYREHGIAKRVTIPAGDVKDGQVNAYNLNLGIPYGVDWAELVTLRATAAQLDQNLKNAGIWTAEDALADAPKVLGVIQATYQVDLAAVLRIAKEVKHGTTR